MSNRFFLKGKQILVDNADWDTDSFKIIQLTLDGTLTDTHVKAITGATVATPCVISSTAHGFSNGDIVVQRGIGGTLSANGTFKIANVATNTYELQNLDGTNAVGVGAYTSGGCVINISAATNLADIDGARVGSDSAALTTPTLVNGTLDADDVSFTGLTGTVHGYAIYKDTGSAATSKLIYFIDGKTQVTVSADAASSATTLWVEKLEGALASALALVFSNGITATLSGGASAAARSLAVNALSGAIAAGHTADAQTTNSGLPLTMSSGSYTLQFDNGTNKIATI